MPANAVDTVDNAVSQASQAARNNLTNVPTICSALRKVMEADVGNDETKLRHRPERDRLLIAYRKTLLAHVQHDTRANIAELTDLIARLSGRRRIDFAATPVGGDLLDRLHQSRQTIIEDDPFLDGRTELRWWLALTQFYLDGLVLADRLLAAKPGDTTHHWQQGPPRREFVGFTIPGRLQAVVSTLETLVPNIFRVNPVNTYLPLALHVIAHSVFPKRPFSFMEAFATTFGWTRRGGFANLRGLKGEVVRFDGQEHLHNNALFDPNTNRTHHNVIIAASHRMGYLDWPLLYEPLRKLRFGVWANNSFLGPTVERKLARERYCIPVAGNNVPPLEISLAKTADLLINARAPVFIMADGRQPSLFYGQQMRVKRGVRLAANETIRRSEGTGRKTYVLPMTLDDPVGFVQGLDDVIRVSFHPPILVDEIIEPKRTSAPADTSDPAAAWDLSDPLLNYLEALFLTHTSHARHGLGHPRIVTAARRRRDNLHREPMLKRAFHTSIADLTRQAVGTQTAPRH